ncbi:hypothetical protein ACQKCH_01370 [Nubsella zeaxanthinifaciens]|uniref:hypothetical protein n=1 Tax=Nubsella zeaxanthinifaciens TaxID=392412 RepID=UPI003D028C6D
MIRYWFEFDFENYLPVPSGTRTGCGVTAYSYEDALNIINEKIFNKIPTAPIKQVVENVDISILDKGHVLPNMGLPNVRGIWFPLGYN